MQGGGGPGAVMGGSDIPMPMRNTVKSAVGKEVKVQKKQSRKEKLANYGGRREDRPSLGVKKPASSSRRSKPRASGVGGGGGGRRSSSHATQMAGHAHGDKILSMDGLFSE